jgi:menaquinone-dependent protoporphyrinogen oxidase
MRVLVAWGSKRGGTEGIARIIGEELEANGMDATVKPASEVRDVEGFDAAIVGGALYANRWHRDAHRFVARNIAGLRRIPVWLFSSGPLDDSADRSNIPPPTEVAVLMERIGARGHATFGGRLNADARGFPAAAMAKTRSGDWRNPDRVRGWAADLANVLPNARPGTAIDPPARSLGGSWRMALPAGRSAPP